jgi:hypothetical protein
MMGMLWRRFTRCAGFAFAAITVFLSLDSCSGVFSSFSGDMKLTASVDSLFVVSGRRVYPVGGSFNREDLTVFATYADGSTRKIPIEDTTISGIDDFNVAGEKYITVEYGGKTAVLSVIVGTDVPETGTPSGGGSGVGIEIIWT